MILKDGTRPGDSRLGRVQLWDPRNAEFPIRSLVAARAPRSYTWSAVMPALDQGPLGACVGFACAGEAAARPKPVVGITNETGKEVYHRAQHIDPWSGCEFGDSGPLMAGTAVLCGMKIGVEKGWWKEYRWAFSVDEIALAVGYAGPVILGIDWYQGMMTPDSTGRIYPWGSLMGGHAIMARGYNVKSGLFRLRNSWGARWGIDGDCFLHRDNLASLMGAGGEAAVPISRQL